MSSISAASNPFRFLETQLLKQISNILLLTDEMGPGGVARHVVDLANGLVDKGIMPIVAANDGPFRGRLRKDIQFVNLPLYLPKSGRKRLLGFVDSYRILLSIIRREQVDLIHSHKRYTDVLGRVLARRMSLPHVSTCHNAFSSLKRFSVFGDMTIACSRAAEEMLIRDFGKAPGTVAQIYSGILPFRKFGKDERLRVLIDLKIPQGRQIVASAGQLIESKDRATLLRAVGILKRRGFVENVMFVVLGDGKQKTMLEELASKEGVQNHLMFLAGTFDVEALFNVADFMVLSSKREGLPYVLIEAASIGKPHIATDVGGVSEFVIPGETGILVPPNNPQKLGDAIQDLLQDPAKVEKLGNYAKEKFLQTFTYDRFIKQTMDVYKSHCANRTDAL